MSAKYKTKPEQLAVNHAVLAFIETSSVPVTLGEIQRQLGFDKDSIDLALKWVSRGRLAEYVPGISTKNTVLLQVRCTPNVHDAAKDLTDRKGIILADILEAGIVALGGVVPEAAPEIRKKALDKGGWKPLRGN